MENPVKMGLFTLIIQGALLLQEGALIIQVSCTRQVWKNMIPLNTHYLPHPTSRAVL
ncbi:hypothetical protein NC651_023468 [Populus alba x Populus x berolinensis]|nr:hypothetical protein NC651_023468 [Populus alba x Populus x berolinensis]